MKSTVDVFCYFHEPLKARLLLDALLPLADRLAADGTAVHLERHWLHGPHIRMRLRGPAAGAAADRAATELRDYLTRHPSTAGIDPAELIARSEVAGRSELVTGPYEPIYPDNTVRVEEADLTGLARLLDGPGAVECRDAVLAAGRPAVQASLRFLDGRPNPLTGRLSIVVTGMAAHADNYPGRLVSGYHSFQSHLEDFLFWESATGLRERFALYWDRLGPGMVDLVRAAIADPAGTPLAQAWQDWTRAAWRLADESYADGRLSGGLSMEYHDRAQTFDERTARKWGGAGREVSPYHHALAESGFEEIAASRRFRVYRFGTNMLYQLFGLCDVAPMERYLGAYLIGRAAQEVTGVTWEQQLAEKAASERAKRVALPESTREPAR